MIWSERAFSFAFEMLEVYACHIIGVVNLAPGDVDLGDAAAEMRYGEPSKRPGEFVVSFSRSRLVSWLVMEAPRLIHSLFRGGVDDRGGIFSGVGNRGQTSSHALGQSIAFGEDEFTIAELPADMQRWGTGLRFNVIEEEMAKILRSHASLDLLLAASRVLLAELDLPERRTLAEARETPAKTVEEFAAKVRRAMVTAIAAADLEDLRARARAIEELAAAVPVVAANQHRQSAAEPAVPVVEPRHVFAEVAEADDETSQFVVPKRPSRRLRLKPSLH